MGSLSDTELVQWDALLESGVTKKQAMQKLRPLSDKTFKSLRAALADPFGVQHLQLYEECEDFPLEVLQLFNLRTLDVSCGFRAVPAELSHLPCLGKLVLSGYDLEELPLAVVAMPSLEELQFEDTSLPKRFHRNRINRLLTELKEIEACHETRLLRFALLLLEEEAPKHANLSRLVAALDSSLVPVRFFALGLLETMLADRKIPLQPGTEIVVMGTLQRGRQELKKALTVHGVTLAKKVGPKTVAIVLGDRPKGQASAHLTGPLVLEVHLQAALEDSRQAGGSQKDVERLRAQLTCGKAKSLAAAMSTMKKTGVPTGVFEELLVVWQNTANSKSIRTAAQKLFALHAPKALRVAVKKALPASIFLSSEDNVRAKIKALATESKGTLDPVKLSTLLLPKAGYSYLFEVGENVEEHAITALHSMLSPDQRSLDLSKRNLSQVPKAITRLPQLEALNLTGNGLKDISVVCELEGLTSLKLCGNPLASLPDKIASLKKLQELDLSDISLRAFPVVCFKLKSLRHLRLGQSRTMREMPLHKLPQRLSVFPLLETLHLGDPFYHPVPKGLEELSVLLLSSDAKLVERAQALVQEGILTVSGTVSDAQLQTAEAEWGRDFPPAYLALMREVGEIGDKNNDNKLNRGGWERDFRRIHGPLSATQLTRRLHKDFGVSGRHAVRVRECYFMAQWQRRSIVYGIDGSGKVRALNLSRPGTIMRTSALSLEAWLMDLWAESNQCQ